MRARDLMSKVDTVGPEDPMTSLADHFRRPDVRLVAVVSEQGDLVGLVTEEDMLSAMLPSYVLADQALASVLEEAAGESLLQRLERKRVRDVVDLSRRDRPRVRPDDTLIEVASAMARSNDPGVLVVQEDRPVGVVTLERLLAACLGPR